MKPRALLEGTTVAVPAWIAAFLEQRLPFADLRVQVRGKDAELDDVLMALHVAAVSHVDVLRAELTSGVGSGVAPVPEVAASSMSATQVAVAVGVDDRTVRLAASTGRLSGVKDAEGRWRFDQTEVVAWAAARETRRTA